MIPKLFIFDMDGLLLDSERAFMQVEQEVMREYGYRLTQEIYLETLGLSAADTALVMASHFGPDYPNALILAESRKRLNARAEMLPLPVKPGIPELLQELTRRGIPSCVASSSPRATIDIYLAGSSLQPFFSHIISGEEITRSKPDPEIFLRCCRHFSTEPEDAVVLEDSENGIRAAVRAGIPVICIPDMKMPAKDLLDAAWFTAADAYEVQRKIFS